MAVRQPYEARNPFVAGVEVLDVFGRQFRTVLAVVVQQVEEPLGTGPALLVILWPSLCVRSVSISLYEVSFAMACPPSCAGLNGSDRF